MIWFFPYTILLTLNWCVFLNASLTKYHQYFAWCQWCKLCSSLISMPFFSYLVSFQPAFSWHVITPFPTIQFDYYQLRQLAHDHKSDGTSKWQNFETITSSFKWELFYMLRQNKRRPNFPLTDDDVSCIWYNN